MERSPGRLAVRLGCEGSRHSMSGKSRVRPRDRGNMRLMIERHSAECEQNGERERAREGLHQNGHHVKALLGMILILFLQLPAGEVRSLFETQLSEKQFVVSSLGRQNMLTASMDPNIMVWNAEVSGNRNIISSGEFANFLCWLVGWLVCHELSASRPSSWRLCCQSAEIQVPAVVINYTFSFFSLCIDGIRFLFYCPASQLLFSGGLNGSISIWKVTFSM
jgi:hypothetical protein